ncbi:MAG: YceD family protein, partial [Candidatus Rokuibacteriota bacterium]
MIIQVSDIQDDGLLVANAGEFVAPFTDRSWRLRAVRLHVSRDGEDVVVVGDLEASVPLVCGRCLEEFCVGVRPRVDVRYVPRPSLDDDVELGADDLDLDFYANDQLNLASLVETETTLALPMKPLCRADCRGLCP